MPRPLPTVVTAAVGCLALSACGWLGVEQARRASAEVRIATRIALAPQGQTTVLTPGTVASPAPRSSPAPDAEPYQVVALGDSVPAGTACDCTPFPELVARSLAGRQGTAAVVHNQAIPGATTGDVLEQLDTGEVQQQLGSADLVLIEIGANDLDVGDDELQSSACTEDDAAQCDPDDVSRVGGNLETILDEVHARVPASARVVVLGYWNVAVDGGEGYAIGDDYVSGARALTLVTNTAIRSAVQQPQDLYVDLVQPFLGSTGEQDPSDLLAADGDHPDAAGHERIAQAILAALG